MLNSQSQVNHILGGELTSDNLSVVGFPLVGTAASLVNVDTWASLPPAHSLGARISGRATLQLTELAGLSQQVKFDAGLGMRVMASGFPSSRQDKNLTWDLEHAGQLTVAFDLSGDASASGLAALTGLNYGKGKGDGVLLISFEKGNSKSVWVPASVVVEGTAQVVSGATLGNATSAEAGLSETLTRALDVHATIARGFGAQISWSINLQQHPKTLPALWGYLTAIQAYVHRPSVSTSVKLATQTRTFSAIVRHDGYIQSELLGVTSGKAAIDLTVGDGLSYGVSADGSVVSEDLLGAAYGSIADGLRPSATCRPN